MQHDHVKMPTWPKTEPEVNSHDVTSRTSGPNVGRFQRLRETFELNQIWYRAQETDRTCRIHLSWKSTRAAATIFYFEQCQCLWGRLRTTTARWLSAYMYENIYIVESIITTIRLPVLYILYTLWTEIKGTFLMKNSDNIP